MVNSASHAGPSPEGRVHNPGMQTSLTIGDFARATHLSVKTLRYYHRVGLLEPADVDAHTGYRRYTVEQIPTAQIIRRFRDLDMPIHEVAAVLSTPDVQARNTLIAGHLNRLEDGMSRTKAAVASLRDLLEHPSPVQPAIGRRTVDATPAAAITETVDIEDALNWYQGALGELYATLAAQQVPAADTAGGIFTSDLFSHERGQVTVFVPCTGTLRPIGRVSLLVIPAVELATIEHVGPHRDIDLAYGTLATYVTRHALAVDGPIREYYPIDRHDTPDETQWRTEVGWPIFRTGV
jgi:DNA-binding transcriptional MerR regulator